MCVCVCACTRACASKDNIRKWKDNPHNGKRFLQIVHLIRSLYLEYIKNSILFKTQWPNFQKQAKNLNRHFPKKVYEWSKANENMPNIISHQENAVPVVSQWKQIRLVSMRLWVWSLAVLSGLGKLGCRELWCRPAAVAPIRPLARGLPHAGWKKKRHNNKCWQRCGEMGHHTLLV